MIYFLSIIIIILVFILLLRSCGNGNKYKIKIHNGNDIIEVDSNFKLSDLDVDGCTVSFLVDSDGVVVESNKKLEKDKEYSTHIIPQSKEIVKVTYINVDKKLYTLNLLEKDVLMDLIVNIQILI